MPPAEQTAADVRALGTRAHVVRAHVGDPDEQHRLFAAVDEAFGRLDIHVANAAQGVFRAALDIDARAWDWTFDRSGSRQGLDVQPVYGAYVTRLGGGVTGYVEPSVASASITCRRSATTGTPSPRPSCCADR